MTWIFFGVAFVLFDVCKLNRIQCIYTQNKKAIVESESVRLRFIFASLFFSVRRLKKIKLIYMVVSFRRWEKVRDGVGFTFSC